jgi:Type VI secretion system/phage-baseplate injector OB domain
MDASENVITGVAVAIVTQNSDPDQLGRVRIRFPWYEKPNESYWARIAVPMAGRLGNTGSTCHLLAVGKYALPCPVPVLVPTQFLVG